MQREWGDGQGTLQNTLMGINAALNTEGHNDFGTPDLEQASHFPKLSIL